MLSKSNKALLFACAFTLTLAGGYLVIRNILPVNGETFSPDYSHYPTPKIVESDSSPHELTIHHYRQIGNEIQLLVYSSSTGIAPFEASIWHEGLKKRSETISTQPGTWLRLNGDGLEGGTLTLKLTSTRDTLCRVTVSLDFDASKINEIADTSHWFRQGSFDDWLDIRVVQKNGRYYLKDFAAYEDGRSKTYFVESRLTDSLESGIEVRPGYLYTVVAKWVEKNYDQWWNKTKYRTSRLQSVWIEPDTTQKNNIEKGILSPIPIPGWFAPSRNFNPHFERIIPEFTAPEGKLVMMYRLNQDVPASEYFKRGITHLPRWEQDIPALQQHWTEAPGFFADRDQAWFGSLSKQEVEEYADRVGKIGVYAFDFEFWNRRYTPKVKERLLWFSHRLKENQPDLYLFDYWGGSAYINTTFQNNEGYFMPLSFARDYQAPRSNHFNFEKTPNGDFFGNYFNITAVDVYPRPQLPAGNKGFNLNNYLVLSAIHSSRVNRMFDYQKNNKTIWFAWNRFMPLYNDPAFPWHVRTEAPAGSLVFQELETLPASQALALSLFSLFEGDGFYLWSDSQPWGKGPNNYRIDRNLHWDTATEWWPADGQSPVESFQTTPGSNESPRYWDYASDYFALGNWMASRAGDVLSDGTRRDLAFFYDGKWQEPRLEQAVLAAHNGLPFVTSVVKGNQIVILALDSFQPANQTRRLLIRLPDGRETEIELYGNWPALYKGELVGD